MVNSCCMIGCKNKQNKDQGISLHRIPPRPPYRRDAWIRAINRLDPDSDTPKQWIPSVSSRICGLHFMGGMPSEDPKHPDFIPNKNLIGPYVRTEKPVKTATDKAVKGVKRKQLKDYPIDTEDAATSLLTLSQASPMMVDRESQTLPLQETETIDRLQGTIQQYEKNVEFLRKKNTTLERKLKRMRLSLMVYRIRNSNSIVESQKKQSTGRNISALCAEPDGMHI